MLRRLLIILGLWTILVPVTAQFDVSEFRWDVIDATFSYPAGWDEPFAVQRFGVETVIIAESEVNNDERAPEIPIILMTLAPPDENDLNIRLENSLSDLDIQIAQTLTTNILGTSAPLVSGTNADESFFGMGTILEYQGDVLTIFGRVPTTQQAQFESIFNLIIRSFNIGTDFGQSVPYGVVWSNVADEDDLTFFDLSGVAIDEANQNVYVIDPEVGLLRFDILSGRLLEIIINPEFVTPLSVAVGAEGIVYVGDPDCPCVHVYQNGEWQDSYDEFGVGSPVSIATDQNGTLYATNNNGQSINVRQFTAEGETRLTPTEPFFAEPILVQVNGQIFAYDDRVLYQSIGTQFILTNSLDIDTSHNYAQIAPDGTYILATDNLIDLYTPTGLLIESIDITETSFGTNIQGLALGQDNTLYVTVADVGFTEVLALSQRVRDNNLGLPILEPYRVSGSFLNKQNTSDTWYFEGAINQIIDVEVQGYSAMPGFDFSVTLIDPAGEEIDIVADDTNPNQVFSRSLNNVELSANGIYEIRLDHIESEGIYDVTLIEPTRIVHDTDQTERYGQIPESYPAEQWVFEAQSQTTLTITADALDPTQFDPQIALYNANGQLVAQNDDASTSAGNSAQITEFTVPFNTEYIIEVSRFEGVGRYRLTIATVEPES